MTPSGMRLFTPEDCPPTVGYPQVALFEKQALAFISGQVGVDSSWRLAPTFEEQTQQAFKNLKAAIEACGATMEDVCKLTIFAVGDADLATYAAIRDTFFGAQQHLPASSFIRVAGLYDPKAFIEIEAVVAVPS
ncbi:endoribonuclease L-PSP protein (plasmid) [Rhizobium gallicum]|uniref:Endoribonuclease L-PSP protein n=1 Tax=Rhizobium gallicum TaxID=56730 RepID=A0A1L5NPJ4_9HYPH|nr:RidA family protein [Rhizobium gallicum]APO69816.1 endoribonuclease L-PSP protein [Rhizobium gallicum]